MLTEDFDDSVMVEAQEIAIPDASHETKIARPKKEEMTRGKLKRIRDSEAYELKNKMNLSMQKKSLYGFRRSSMDIHDRPMTLRRGS